MREISDPSHAYRLRVDEIIAALQSDDRTGLTDDDARARRERFGDNELTAEPPIPAWRRFSRNFRMCSSSCCSSPPPFRSASGSSSATRRLPYEAIAILAVVLLNATMGYVQEASAESAVAALRAMSAARRHCRSRRRTAERGRGRDRARRHHSD